MFDELASEAQPIHEPGPAPQPAPADVPAPDPSVTGAPAQPDLGTPNPPAPQQPGLWRRVLQGALSGLMMGGIPGAVEGAVDPKRVAQIKDDQQRIAQNDVRFSSAQAAAQVADAATKDQMLHNLPQDLQDKHNAAAAEVLKNYSSLFGTPSVVVPNTGAHALEQLRQTTAGQGAVDHTLFVNTGDTIYGWDTGSAAEGHGALGFVRSAAKALGLAQFSNMTDGQFKALDAKTKADLMARANDVHGVVIPAVGRPTANDPDTKGLEGQLTRLQTEQRILSAGLATDASLQPLLNHVGTNIDLVQGELDKQKQAFKTLSEGKTQQQIKVGAANAAARTNGLNEAKVRSLLGPDGELHDYAYNESTKSFDRDQGLTGTGQQGSRMSAAAVSYKISNDAIGLIQQNMDKLGTLTAWVQSKGLNTPIADPTLAKVQAVISSVAATQPAQHAFRAASAAEAFEKIIGGLQKNPRATIAAIQGLNMTSRAINPALGKGGTPSKPFNSSGTSGFSVTDPNGKVHPFDTQEQADNFRKLIGAKK